jgi:hypothetical protein
LTFAYGVCAKQGSECQIHSTRCAVVAGSNLGSSARSLGRVKIQDMQDGSHDRDTSDEARGAGLSDVVRALKVQIHFIAAFAFLGLVAMGVYTSVTKLDYTVTSVVMPPPEGGAQGLASQFGALANAASSLAGLRLRGGGDDAGFTALRQLLVSPRLYEEMERRDPILRLFYPERWDFTNNKWRADKSGIQSYIDSVKKAFDIPVFDGPTISDFTALLGSRLSISQIELSDLYEVEFRYKDPAVATQLLSRALSTADALVRADASKRIQDQILYIGQRLQNVTVQEHRQALASLLLTLERQGMLAAGGENYAMVVLQAPTIVAHPRLAGLVGRLALGLLGGILLAMGMVLMFSNVTRTFNDFLAKMVAAMLGMSRKKRPNTTLRNAS